MNALGELQVLTEFRHPVTISELSPVVKRARHRWTLSSTAAIISVLLGGLFTVLEFQVDFCLYRYIVHIFTT